MQRLALVSPCECKCVHVVQRNVILSLMWLLFFQSATFLMKDCESSVMFAVFCGLLLRSVLYFASLYS